MSVRKIISGGQTGADRAALDFALENNFETGGWIPKNRQAEDGKIPDKYPNLRETREQKNETRTEFNVRDSDATLIFSHGFLQGGSELTLEFAGKYQKPCLHVDFEKKSFQEAIETARKWFGSIDCRVLNVAGSKISEDAEIYQKTKNFLEHLFKAKV